MPATDHQVRVEATALAENLAAFCKRLLGPDFIAFYLLGSLAHGGFNRRYSDIDVALISEKGIDDVQRDAFRAEAETLSPKLAGRVSLFWTDRKFSIGRFPPLDRLDYIDRAVPVTEREKIFIERPGPDEIRAYLRGTPFQQWAGRGSRFATQSALAPADRKTYLKTHLYPARFAYSWLTGTIASNDDAIAYLRDQTPPGLDMALLGRALECRHDAADPDYLFGDRLALPAQYHACRQLMEG